MIIQIDDPYDIVSDCKLRSAAAALAPTQFEAALRRVRLPSRPWQLRAIRVVRHKPGRRCLIEYDLLDCGGATITLIGKMRAKGADRTTYDLVRDLWTEGFAVDAVDGIAVPEPVGVIDEFDMWLQRKAPGRTAAQHLIDGDHRDVARQAADALAKLHRSAPPINGTHSVVEELATLDHLLTKLADCKPAWAERLRHLSEACHRHAGLIDPGPNFTIHRDYYPEQLLIDGGVAYLLDLDLCAIGDPALDAGNFIGHLIELGLRDPSLTQRMAEAAAEFAQRYLALCDREDELSLRIYALLTLARHVGLSPRFPDRQHATERLLDHCERLLALNGGQSWVD